MAEPERARLAVVGLSVNSTCGVRDHAQLLAAELERAGHACSMHWLTREQRTLAGSRRELGAWCRGLRAELARERPEAILLHYSVFSYAHRGVPVFEPQVLSVLAAAGIPVVGILHEIVYRWSFGGWRGKVWAATQRVALAHVIHVLDAAVVTADERVGWLRSRRWLPRRPITLAPVYSNLPAPAVPAPGPRPDPLVGLFGYGYQGAAVRLLLEALARVRAGGVPLRLRLLGAPGPDSQAGATWRQEADRRGLADALSFTGRLPAQELADALGGCEVLLFADDAGPTSRKGTLAGSLASGRPLVAIDGRQTWPELREAGAVRLAAADPQAIAAALAQLLADRAEREALGARGRAFAASRMGIARTVAAVEEALAAVLPA